MSVLHKLVPVLAVLALSACVVAPPPSLVAVPGDGKTQAAFEQDDQACRQQAGVAGPGATAPATAPGQYDPQTAYTQCMIARGNKAQEIASYPAYSGYAYPNAYPYAYPYYPYYPYAYPYYGFYGGPAFAFRFGGGCCFHGGWRR